MFILRVRIKRRKTTESQTEAFDCLLCTFYKVYPGSLPGYAEKKAIKHMVGHHKIEPNRLEVVYTETSDVEEN